MIVGVDHGAEDPVHALSPFRCDAGRGACEAPRGRQEPTGGRRAWPLGAVRGDLLTDAVRDGARLRLAAVFAALLGREEARRR